MTTEITETYRDNCQILSFESESRQWKIEVESVHDLSEIVGNSSHYFNLRTSTILSYQQKCQLPTFTENKTMVDSVFE